MDDRCHVAAVLESVDGPVSWMGHSFGARLVAEMTARHPELVERVVLLDVVKRRTSFPGSPRMNFATFRSRQSKRPSSTG